MKRFFSFLAAAAMLFTASCSNEDLGADEGDEAVVSFSMNLQGASSSKAIGDGTTVNKLVYSVYEIEKDAEGNVTSSRFLFKNDETFTNVQFPVDIEIRLAKNKDFRVVFWAQNNECEAYTLSYEDGGMTVAVNYEGLNNDEKRDAFFAYEDLKLTGSIQHDVTLYRPFAQLNVGITDEDYNASVESNAVVGRSKVTVKNVANSINLFNGEIGENTTEVTYEYAEIPSEKLTVDIDGDEQKEMYNYLSMSYLLVEKNDVSVDFLFKTNSNEIDFSLATVPVERNHRTNIIGNILTGNVSIKVMIDAEFDNDYNVLPIVVMNAEQLQAAIDAAQPGINTIMFSANIKGDVVIPQTEGTNIVIDGANYKYDGTMNIRGNNRFEGEETLVIKNVNFETATASEVFIWSDSQNAPDRYAHNITIENCTFTATDAAKKTAVGFKIRQAYNIAMNGCTATDMHSMLQATSIGTDVIVDGATINGEKNGLSFAVVKNAIVTNANIKVAGYGIRFDGEANEYALNVKDCNIEAFQPVVIRDMVGQNNTFNFEGNNTFTTTEAYQIVITKGDDGAAYEVPTGTYELIGAENFVVYPIAVVANDATELEAALAAGESPIILAKNVNYGTITAGELKDITIVGSENSVMTFTTDENSKLENVTLKNVNFVYDGTNVNSGIVINSEAQIDNLVIDGCTFTGTGAKAGRGIYGHNPNATIVVKNCTFKDLGYPVYAWGGYESLTIEGCTFNNIRSWAIMPQSGFDGDLTVLNCNFIDLAGGIIKAGTLTAGHKFTFTNNVITNSVAHPNRNWFEFNVSAGTKVISGNKMDGVDWTPGTAEGLK